MDRHGSAIALALAGVLASFGAAAETFDVEAKPGAATAIGGLLAYAPDRCRALAVPTARVTRPPGAAVSPSARSSAG